MRLSRLVPVGLLALWLAGCGGSREPAEPPGSYAPLAYDYLTPIRLNVASVDVDPRFVPAGTGDDMSPYDPAPPVEAIRRMALDRLQPLGTAGRAVLAINDASVVRRGDAYEGAIAVELDIYTSAGDRAAFAEARVSARRGRSDTETRRQALYALTKQLMDSLNVELEFQARHSLRDWILPEPVSTPAPVEQQDLPPPKV